MAGVVHLKILTNNKLNALWQVCVARHCAKPLVIRHFGAAQCHWEAKNKVK